jgi:hypothetical protein
VEVDQERDGTCTRVRTAGTGIFFFLFYLISFIPFFLVINSTVASQSYCTTLK